MGTAGAEFSRTPQHSSLAKDGISPSLGKAQSHPTAPLCPPLTAEAAQGVPWQSSARIPIQSHCQGQWKQNPNTASLPEGMEAESHIQNSHTRIPTDPLPEGSTGFPSWNVSSASRAEGFNQRTRNSGSGILVRPTSPALVSVLHLISYLSIFGEKGWTELS